MKKKIVKFFSRNKEAWLNVMFCGLSLVGTFGVVKAMELSLGGSGVGNSFLVFVLFFVELYFYKKVVKRHSKSETIFEVIFSIFVAGVLIIGAELDSFSRILWTFGTFAKIGCLAVFVYSVVNMLMTFIETVKVENFTPKNKKKFFWVTFAIILAGGVIVWLATYPGIWGYDAATQFATITNVDESYTRSVGAHYSLPLGWLMSSIMTMGNNMFGSYQAGLALCCFLQMLFLTYVATRMVVFSTAKIKNIYLYVVAVGFFALFPLYTAMTVYMTQDAVFGGLFALVTMNLYELVTDKDYWKKKIKPICLAVLLLLVCLSRNNGFYCVLIALPFTLVVAKGKRWMVLAIFALPMLLYQIYNGPILKALDISTASSISEMMSVPSQQIARVYNYNRGVIDEDDLEKINTYYKNYKDFAEYIQYPSIADFTKRYMVRENVSGDLMGYVGLWLKLGVKSPRNYIEAFLLNNIGFWYPNKNYPDSRMGIPYYEYDMTDRGDDRFLVIERDSKIPILNNLLRSVLVDDAFTGVPVFSTICSMGFYFLLFCFVVGFSIAKRKWKNFAVIGMVLGIYVTLLLSPIAVFRYCFPIVILWPLFVVMLFDVKGYWVAKKKKNVIE